jgi:hypothetical protein
MLLCVITMDNLYVCDWVKPGSGFKGRTFSITIITSFIFIIIMIINIVSVFVLINNTLIIFDIIFCRD